MHVCSLTLSTYTDWDNSIDIIVSLLLRNLVPNILLVNFTRLNLSFVDALNIVATLCLALLLCISKYLTKAEEESV